MMYHVKIYSLSSQNTARCCTDLTQLDETKRAIYWDLNLNFQLQNKKETRIFDPRELKQISTITVAFYCQQMLGLCSVYSVITE